MEGDKISFFVALAVVIIIASSGYYYLSSMPEIPINSNTPSASDSAEKPASGSPNPPTNPVSLGAAAGIQATILQEGNGDGAKAGDTVTVNYTGMFADGKVFDSSIPRGQPFVFNLGAGQVIKGWDDGLVGMKVGEKRKLVLPPEFGYGSRGTPGGEIPPNATLIFEVEMLKIN